MVDCLNHTSRRTLNGDCAQSRHQGYTADISVFRFAFWQPVWYFESNAKFPEPPFKPARFIGIAWDHGDPFTYHVWTEVDGSWKQGRDLVRNILKPRVVTNDEQPEIGTLSEQETDLVFKSAWWESRMKADGLTPAQAAHAEADLSYDLPERRGTK